MRPGMEEYTTGTGQRLWVHSRERCTGEHCVIHRPSDHSMREFPTHWRDDTKVMEQICPHGVGHPDPDDIAFKRAKLGDSGAWAWTVHGCDGCCNDALPELPRPA